MSLLNDSSLVIWYPLSEGSGTAINDLSGEGNVGTASNISWQKIKTGQYALDFNGSNSSVNIPNDASFNFTSDSSYTINAWVNIDDISTVRLIYSQIPNTCGQNYFVFYANSASKKYFCVHLYRDCGGGNTNAVYSTTEVNPGTWQMVSCTYNGTNLKIYVDGVQEANADYIDYVGAPTTAATVDATLGYDKRSGNKYMDGKMANVMVFNRCLTDNEIKALYEKTYIE